MERNGKRSWDQFQEEVPPDDNARGNVGVGANFERLGPSELEATDISLKQEVSINGANGERDGGWTEVLSKGSRNRRNKRQKKEKHVDEEVDNSQNGKSTYPGLKFAELHKLHSMLKLDDLQTLLLYCLAEGTAPQWVSVRHHAAIRKAVVLMVPGLEGGMFDGTIPLPEPVPADELLNELEASDGSSRDPSNAPPVSNNAEPVSINAEPKSIEAKLQSHVATQTVEHVGNRNWAANLSPDEYLPSKLDVDKLPASLQPLSGMFVHLWPVKTPGDDRSSKLYSPLHAMLTAHVPRTQEEKDSVRNTKGPKSPSAGKYWENVPTQVHKFLTSKEDLQENDYTLHPAAFEAEEEKSSQIERRKAANETLEDGWVDTAIEKLGEGDVPENSIAKGSLTAGRTVFAMDCEMCTVEGGEAALTRISLVSWDGTVVIDELVKPLKPIIDYLTPYSGITPTALAPITTTLATIQSRLLALLTPTTILIGHSLNADLTALKLTHPFIIDTSLLYPHPRGPPLKSSLKWLSQKYLSREIQQGHGATGHNSIEDARACLDLARLKCEKGPRWGAQDADRESIFKRLARVPKPGTVTPAGKQGAIVDHGHPDRNFGQMVAAYSIPCTTDAAVVAGIHRAVHGDPDGTYIPGGGVELTWARLRELEALRGWSNDHRTPSIPPNPHPSTTPTPSPQSLTAAVAQTVQHIAAVHASLPPCTLLLVYSGTGDPRELVRMQEAQRVFRREYKVKKWDELSVRWTDAEEEGLRGACRRARVGVGFVCVK